jgi:hypothetical protein
VLALLILFVVVVTTVWVGVDASKRDFGEKGTGTSTWVLGCLLLWIVVFPYYLAKRGRAPLKGQPLTGRPVAAIRTAMYRECPYCKEPMRRDASVCPHCRNGSPAWRLHEGRWWFRETDEAPWRWYDEETGDWVAHST